jgi:protein-tyrosine-phosphatase/predicted ATP-grasp superfamily ATP-dependent carboligase
MACRRHVEHAPVDVPRPHIDRVGHRPVVGPSFDASLCQGNCRRAPPSRTSGRKLKGTSVMPAGRALILGNDTRSFLSVVRSLGRKGIEIHVCPGQAGTPALASRHISKVHRLPPYGLDPMAWVMALRSLLEQYAFDLIIPCEDAGQAACHAHAAELTPHRFAIPNDLAFECFVDKAATRALATSCGVPVAAGKVLSATDTAENLGKQFGLPLAIKPRCSISLAQPDTRQSVQIAGTMQRLTGILGGISARQDFFAEAFFSGEGVGVSVLACRGKVTQAFQHRRVLEAGPTSGSAYRTSEPLDPSLLAHVTSMCSASNLDGVAMFEFRRSRGGQTAILLEVNARVWGSLPLAIASGIDFPALLYDQLVHKTEAPRLEYRNGLYARSLTSDVYARLAAVQDKSRPLTARLLDVPAATAQAAYRLITGRESWDTWAWDDPGPFRSEVRELSQAVVEGVQRRLPFANALRRTRAMRALRTIVERHRGEKLKVLVMCFGNISRSPFAAAQLRARLSDRIHDFEVQSAGLLPKAGRAAPTEAIGEARKLGVSLDAHRSVFADDPTLESAHVILVFDRKNLSGLKARGLEYRAPVIQLGDFLDGESEIEDPFGRGEQAFARAYREISEALDRIEPVLRASGHMPTTKRPAVRPGD